jgi:hypothetical protein
MTTIHIGAALAFSHLAGPVEGPFVALAQPGVRVGIRLVGRDTEPSVVAYRVVRGDMTQLLSVPIGADGVLAAALRLEEGLRGPLTGPPFACYGGCVGVSHVGCVGVSHVGCVGVPAWGAWAFPTLGAWAFPTLGAWAFPTMGAWAFPRGGRLAFRLCLLGVVSGPGLWFPGGVGRR